jgi:chloramphenicol 3-O phosphotransferase
MIILLNGPSSSGKTSIAQAIQEKYDKPIIHVGTFSFMDMVHSSFKGLKNSRTSLGFYFTPKIVNGARVYNFGQGPYGDKIIKSAFRCIKLLSETNDLIIEEVISSKKELLSYLEILNGQNVYFVGVKCPLGIIEQREKGRNNRIPGQSKAVYFKIHPKTRKYDLELDTSKLSPEECATTILSYVTKNPNPKAWNLSYL